MAPIQTVCVVGLGYIGLPTAAVLASRGIKVTGVDVDPVVIEAINDGRVHIVEPGLPELVADVVGQGLLHASAQPEAADVFIIAVPTPFAHNKLPDLSYVKAAAEAVAPHLSKGSLLIVESTCPVGATQRAETWLAAARPDLSFPVTAGEAADVMVAYCPERVLPGKVLTEIVSNDRVIGGLSASSTVRAEELYRLFITGECVGTDARTAEMCKLTENAFRDVNIAFANELSLICAHLSIDVWELIGIANRHPRVNILQPGPGVGGHCIAVDPWFIVSSAPEQARLIRSAREVNDGKPLWVVQQVREAVLKLRDKGLDRPARIACFGLTFKPDVDDFRESPAVQIVELLIEAELGELLVVDPYLDKLPRSLYGRVTAVSQQEAQSSADISLIMVDHRGFRTNFHPAGVIIDCKGLTRVSRSA